MLDRSRGAVNHRDPSPGREAACKAGTVEADVTAALADVGARSTVRAACSAGTPVADATTALLVLLTRLPIRLTAIVIVVVIIIVIVAVGGRLADAEERQQAA